MKIVIINAYCYLNKGDAGIIKTMVREIKKKYPESNITVVSMYPKTDTGKYGNCKVIGPIIKPYSGKNKYIKVIRNMTLYFYYLFLDTIVLNSNSTIHEIKIADVVISCGGGFFQAKSFKYFLSSFLYHLIQLKVAVRFKKPLFLYAQTIGPFCKNWFVRNSVKKILKAAKIIMARESITYHYVNNFMNGQNVNCYLTSDIAFILKKEEFDTRNILLNSKYKIGITLREWYFPGLKNHDRLKKNYKQSIIELLKYLTSRKDVSVYLLPQVIGPNQDNDLIISRDIYSNLSNKGNINLMERDIKPENLKYIYSKLNLLIGTRMHSNIFALSERTPCVAISYDLKTNGIMSDMGLNDYVVDINTITPEKIINKVKQAIQSLPSLKLYINNHIESTINKSKKNNILLFNYIDNNIL